MQITGGKKKKINKKKQVAKMQMSAFMLLKCKVKVIITTDNSKKCDSGFKHVYFCSGWAF